MASHKSATMMSHPTKITLAGGWLDVLPEGRMFLGHGWTVSTEDQDDPNFNKAMEVARGKYQQNLLLGLESLSGSTLRGKAKQFQHRYQTLRDELFERMQGAGVVFSEQRINRRRVLVIGYWSDAHQTPKPEPFQGEVHCMDDLFL